MLHTYCTPIYCIWTLHDSGTQKIHENSLCVPNGSNKLVVKSAKSISFRITWSAQMLGIKDLVHFFQALADLLRQNLVRVGGEFLGIFFVDETLGVSYC